MVTVKPLTFTFGEDKEMKRESNGYNNLPT